MNQDPQVNPNKLFVGNLPYSVTESQLTDMFSPYGDIKEVKLITDRFSGRSKGIAFVEYASQDQAQAAIEALNNSDMQGRAMIVNVARPQVPRENRSYGGGNNRGGGYGGGGYGGGNRGSNRY